MDGWRFIDDSGDFHLESPQATSGLYFPLVNEAGMISVVTPLLHGDVKTGQHTFLTLPVSVEDLHNTRSGRNFWVASEKHGAWSAAGNSARQTVQRFSPGEDAVSLDAGFLWQRLTRSWPASGLRAEITSFVPAARERVELMKVVLTNLGAETLELTPTAAIPIYGRSADNLRDHRHVTSLLQRVECRAAGVLVCPTLSFDERGHRPNRVTYAVLGVEGDGTRPAGFFPLVEDFIGEGGSLDWPAGVVDPVRQNSCVPAGTTCAGYEALGGIRFRDVSLVPGERRAYVILLAVLDETESAEALLETYASEAAFDAALERTRTHWNEKLSGLSFHSGEKQLDLWLRWVGLQPILRRLLGNSFLPYHDYGRGGRGWRDLWQDVLALLVMDRGQVDEQLWSSFAGVRLDGSNATIIGSRPGEFKADRNDIPRTWMDHGAWPFLTTRLYVDQSGDLDFLLREQVYFKDRFACRTREIDSEWEPAQGIVQRTVSGEVYSGSILEHLLVQHLTAFFNVGAHNMLRLEGGDWNDGMDMGARRGESVAFSAFYAGNLFELSGLVLKLGEKRGLYSIGLAAELLPLLDTVENGVDYTSPAAKQARLGEYFHTVRHTISGKKVSVRLVDLARDLRAKADSLSGQICAQEWIEGREGYAWFNGYYDDDGQRLEGDDPGGVRMTLTGQVFPLMCGLTSREQARAVARAVERNLHDPALGGPRLNTDLKEVRLNLGRFTGFAYGHKENGSMFSHMAVMYAYGLYRQGLAREGYRVLEEIYRHCVDFAACKIYPGIPEYMSDRGRGMYPYLTGSASWYLLTLLTQSYGLRGDLGDLILDPQLVREQFDGDGRAGVRTLFAGQTLEVTFINPKELDAGERQVGRALLDGKELTLDRPAGTTRIPRSMLAELDANVVHELVIELEEKAGARI
ncbi:MAG TPA: cellobiose phosphorylase [Anaerolineaceae bacterium]|nr:cellobiose phosphorylase [Anaerolineaceae bacterium]